MGIFLFGIFRTFLTMFALFQSFLYMLNKWTLTCTSLFCVFFFVFVVDDFLFLHASHSFSG